MRPRPARASGRVTTAATSCGEASRASSEGTAVSGVPARTSRTQRLPKAPACGLTLTTGAVGGPVGLADQPHRLAALLGVEPVDEQDAVEVVGLVLHRPRQQVGALDGDRLAERVPAAGDDLHRPRGVEAQPGQRQAPLRPGLLLVAEGEVGVDEVADGPVDAVGEHPQPDAQLGGGQTGRPGIQHGVGEVADQATQLGVEVDDRCPRGCAGRGRRTAGWG